MLVEASLYQPEKEDLGDLMTQAEIIPIFGGLDDLDIIHQAGNQKPRLASPYYSSYRGSRDHGKETGMRMRRIRVKGDEGPGRSPSYGQTEEPGAARRARSASP